MPPTPPPAQAINRMNDRDTQKSAADDLLNIVKVRAGVGRTESGPCGGREADRQQLVVRVGCYYSAGASSTRRLVRPGR